MSPKVKLAVTAGMDGWCYVHLPNPSERLYVRVEAFEDTLLSSEERDRAFDKPEYFKVVELYLDGDGGVVTAEFLRLIPISAIESVINSSPLKEQVFKGYYSNGYTELEVARDLSHFQNNPRNKARAREKIRRPTPEMAVVKRVSISRPKDGKLSDDFLTRVAKFYRVSVSLGEKPILKLSEVAEVPRETAVRWVKLARKRGFLASGEPGKVS